MDRFLIYLIESSLLLSVGVALFMLLMSSETMHRLNRWLLLFVAFMAIVLPTVPLNVDSPMAALSSVIESVVKGNAMNLVNSDRVYDMSAVLQPITDNAYETQTAISSYRIMEYVTVLYFTVVALLIIRLLYMYIQVARILRNGVDEDISGYISCNARLVVHDGSYKPFSWLGYIAISRSDLEDGGREIIIHEAAHIRYCHSLDILFADLLIILQWFNPMAWVMKNLLKDIHEYEADSAVLAAGVNAKQYQLLIIKKAVGARLYSIANSFNHSLTKKRITMMCKEKSSLWHCAKALYIVPLAVIAACTFSSSANSEPLVKVNEKVEISENVNQEKYLDSANVERTKEVVTLKIRGNGSSNSSDESSSVERMPEFKGGATAMLAYISTNIIYPQDCVKNRVEGKTYVMFNVATDGSLKDVNIAKTSGNNLLDEEAVRVVKSMPAFIPGLDKNGNAIQVRYMLPVAFKLQ